MEKKNPNFSIPLFLGFLASFFLFSKAQAYDCNIDGSETPYASREDFDLLTDIVLGSGVGCEDDLCDFDDNGVSPDIGDMAAYLDQLENPGQLDCPLPQNLAPTWTSFECTPASGTAPMAVDCLLWGAQDPESDPLYCRYEWVRYADWNEPWSGWDWVDEGEFEGACGQTETLVFESPGIYQIWGKAEDGFEHDEDGWEEEIVSIRPNPLQDEEDPIWDDEEEGEDWWEDVDWEDFGEPYEGDDDFGVARPGTQ